MASVIQKNGRELPRRRNVRFGTKSHLIPMDFVPTPSAAGTGKRNNNRSSTGGPLLVTTATKEPPRPSRLERLWAWLWRRQRVEVTGNNKKRGKDDFEKWAEAMAEKFPRHREILERQAK